LAQVGFVDFGCTFELPPEIVEADRALFLAIIHRDGEELRYAAHRCGLIRKAQAQTFDSTNYRSWEQLLSAPFLTTEPAELHPSWARELTDQTWRLLKTGRIALAPAALLLWRQRLGVLAVLAGLRPRLPLRRLLADLLDDGVNPVPLYERYR
jgi:predicted unusual protein kinase regulating ubiquinone biosynthesis (AarF/ABC1/UbiB family)